MTAGTLFDRRRTPLTVWFTACWMFASQKDGVSGLSLQRALEIGSYPTAWAMLHRLRSVLVRPGRDRLTGTVEVDETYIGGQEPGLRGGRAKGKKSLIGVAVELAQPRGYGRVRMAILADASAASLHPFVTDNIAPGATVITDAWQGYRGIDKLGYTHDRRSQRAARARGQDPGELLPGVHRVASLAKRWLLGTHQGSVEEAHLQSYLNEFTFRFNRRHSRSRGMVFYRVLELAVEHPPVRFRDLVADPQPKTVRPLPPGSGGHPPIPWPVWVGLIEPYYYQDRVGKRGRKAKPVETMLRMYLLQVWFSLSDEGVEEAVYDSYAMRAFMGLDFAVEQVPDATTLLHFRHLLEKHGLGERLLAAQNEIFETQGWIMRGGSIVDATIIAAPSSTKNASGKRDPQMHQTKKGNQWYFGMKAHIGVDAGTGYVHTVTCTGANVHDLDQIADVIRVDDEVVYADAGYQGAEKRPEIAADEHHSGIAWRIAARKGVLKTMPEHDRALESRKAGVRAKVEHPFLIVKRDFGFVKTRYRGIAKNRNHLHILFASANWLMRARAVALTG